MKIFGNKHSEAGAGDFGYLDPKAAYFDAACQTLRPAAVIAAQDRYFREYNACGGRVKYEWGQKVDAAVEDTRSRLLRRLGKSSKDYTVGFCLNTTHGINMVLSQLPAGRFKSVVTSEIEHNSVFLPTMAAAKRLGIPRNVLKRDDSGLVQYQPGDLDQAVVLVNSHSNIDARAAGNLPELAQDLHARGGVLLVDAAQGMTFGVDLLKNTDFDALFGSSHKMYGPSLGFVVIKKQLLKSLDGSYIGGGTVLDVRRDDYDLVTEDVDLPALLEPGLQNFSGIVGLQAALEWLDSQDHAHDQYFKLGQSLFDGLKAIPGLTVVNQSPSPVVSVYSDKVDAHRLAIILSQQGIMVRSGYYCVHYYLKHVKNFPPLLRFSAGLYNTPAQAAQAVETVAKIIHNL